MHFLLDFINVNVVEFQEDWNYLDGVLVKYLVLLEMLL